MLLKNIINLKNKPGIKGIKIFSVLLVLAALITTAIFAVRNYSLYINLVRITAETSSNKQEVKVPVSAVKSEDKSMFGMSKEERDLEDTSMEAFYNDGQYIQYEMGKEEIDMKKVDNLMKIFNRTKTITVISARTPLTLAAECIPNIIDKGVAAEMIRRTNNLPDIYTEIKNEYILIPMIE